MSKFKKIASLEIDGSKFPLRSGEVYLLGRQVLPVEQSLCEILLNSETVDVKHAILDFHPKIPEIIDLKSKFGTFLDNRRIDSLTKATFSTSASIQFGSVEGRIIFVEGSKDDDSIGFCDDRHSPKNMSEVICPSQENSLDIASSNRLKRINKNTSTPNPSLDRREHSEEQNIPHILVPVNPCHSYVGNNTSAGDSFTIPETQQFKCPSINSTNISLAINSDCNGNVPNRKDNQEDCIDFCIPETQEFIICTQMQKQRKDATIGANHPVDIFADNDDEDIFLTDSQFRICTEDFNNVDYFDDDGSNDIPNSLVIPRIVHSPVLLQGNEHNEMSALNWSEQESSLAAARSTKNPNERDDNATPDLTELPEAKNNDDLISDKTHIFQIPKTLPDNASEADVLTQIFTKEKCFSKTNNREDDEIFKNSDNTDHNMLDPVLPSSDKENIPVAVDDDSFNLPSTDLFAPPPKALVNPAQYSTFFEPNSTQHTNSAEKHTVIELGINNVSDDDDNFLQPTQLIQYPLATKSASQILTSPKLNHTVTTSKETGLSPTMFSNKNTNDDIGFLGLNTYDQFTTLPYPATSNNATQAENPKNLTNLTNSTIPIVKERKSASVATVGWDNDELMCTPQCFPEQLSKSRRIIGTSGSSFNGIKEISVFEAGDIQPYSFDDLLPHDNKKQIGTNKGHKIKDTYPHRESSNNSRESRIKRNEKSAGTGKTMKTQKSTSMNNSSSDAAKKKTNQISSRIETKRNANKMDSNSTGGSKQKQPKLQSEKDSTSGRANSNSSNRTSPSISVTRVNSLTDVGSKTLTSDEHILSGRRITRSKSKEAELQKRQSNEIKSKHSRMTSVPDDTKQMVAISELAPTTRSKRTVSSDLSKAAKFSASNNETEKIISPLATRSGHSTRDALTVVDVITKSKAAKIETNKSTVAKKGNIKSIKQAENVDIIELIDSDDDEDNITLAQMSRKRKTEKPISVSDKRLRSNLQSSVKKPDPIVVNAPSAQKPRRPILVSHTTVDNILFNNLACHANGLWKIAKDPVDSDVLIMNKGNRTFKFLIAMAKGIPVVTSEWLKEVNKLKSAEQVVPFAPYVLVDKEFEKRYKFNLHQSIRKAQHELLFKGIKFFITAGVRPNPMELKVLITLAGGVVLDNIDEAKDAQRLYLVSERADNQHWHKFRRVNRNINIISTEGVMFSVMRQQVQSLDSTIIG